MLGTKRIKPLLNLSSSLLRLSSRKLAEVHSIAHFFSLQADGSTDCATIEQELYLCLFFYPSSIDGRVHVRDLFFAVRQPKATDTQGLYTSVLHFNTWELITGRVN